MRRTWILLATALLFACDPEPTTVLDAGASDAAPSDAEPSDAAPSVDAGPSGPARLVFDLDATASDFFAFPFPSDLRLDADGTPDMEGFPSARGAIVRDLLELADARPAWPTVPVAFFRFTARLADRSGEDHVFAAELASPFLLIDVDARSSERGRLIPTIARTLPSDRYTGENLVAVAAVPGWVLEPEHTYAFVIRASALGADDRPIELEPTLEALLSGERPSAPWGERALMAYAPLRETMASLGLAPDQIAAATVFTTADVVRDLRSVVEGVRARDAITLTDLSLVPSAGDPPRYCELHARASMPQYQEGTPPFDTEGHLAIGGDGLPVEQRREDVPIVITLPRAEMPSAGYPLYLYIHGSGGVASQLVDRSPVDAEGNARPGEGPAYVVAEHGIAAVGAAMPLSPDRLPGASDTAYLNFANLDAFPSTFHQGVIEQALLLDALGTLELPPALLEGCVGPRLPTGASAFRFDLAHLVAGGQSMGAMYVNMLAAIDGRPTAVLPTGAGGFWSYMILETSIISNPRAVLGGVLRVDGAELSHLHPAMQLLQLAWESADPIVFAPRISRRPLAGFAARPIYEVVGQGDSYFSTSLFDAMALAYGHRQAGDVVWPSMQARLAWAGLDGLIDYPIEDDLEGTAGPYTGAVIQSAGDGFSDGHNVFMQIPEIRSQWGCFLASAVRGRARIEAPGAGCAP